MLRQEAPVRRTLLFLIASALILSGGLAAQETKTPPAAKAVKPAAATVPTPAPKRLLNESALSGLALRNIGPAIMSGRISDIAIHPTKRHAWYVAVGSGGVWKTENAGTTWTPVFDSQSSYSIGCITLDPSNPDTVWVGTGENVSGRHVGIGDGVYKSLNGGKTWTNMGLKAVGAHRPHPRRPAQLERRLRRRGRAALVVGRRARPLQVDRRRRDVDALARDQQGHRRRRAPSSTRRTPTSSTPPRTSGGARWRRSWAAARSRASTRATDAGKTWRKLTVGLPEGDKGKIGLAVSPIDPRVVYATVEASPDERGFYRSTNRGESWEKRNSLHQRRHRPALLPGDLRRPEHVRPRLPDGPGPAGDRRRRQDVARGWTRRASTATTTRWRS